MSRNIWFTKAKIGEIITFKNERYRVVYQEEKPRKSALYDFLYYTHIVGL